MWREGDAWYMVLVSGRPEGGGMALLYRSADLLDPDGSLYAPLTLKDAQGRRLLWGWLDEQRSRAAQRAARWAGVTSLPRVLSLDEGGLRTDFAPELRGLRREGVQLDRVDVAESVRVEGVKGPACELRLRLERGDAVRSGLLLARSPHGEEEAHVYVDWEGEHIVIDREHSRLLEGVEGRVQSGALSFADTVELPLYLDGSVLELVADGRLALSTRIYPSRGDSLELHLFSRGGVSKLAFLKAWALASIW